MSDEIRMTLLHHSTNDLIEELLMWRGLAAEHLDRIAELEAENNELTERVSMLDVTGVFQKLGEMRTIELVADLKAERDEAKAMVERFLRGEK
mgnify:FL=1